MNLPTTPLALAARDAVQRIQSAGFTAYWAGGCVRDMLLGTPPKDFDIATSATPAEIARRFPDSREVGKAFGVMIVNTGGETFEVATFRNDGSYTDGRRPDRVVFSTPREDAERRDFTINAMFYDPIANQLHDFVGGQADLSARVLRCVGEPDRRFNEDHLRMLRAVRFASVLEFAIHPDTAQAIRAHAPRIARISAERISIEITRTLTEAKRAGQAVALLDELGLLAHILPEIAAMKGVEQPPEFHPEGDVWAHTILMLDSMAHPTPELAWSVLLHDVGKPSTFERAPDRIRFNEHDEAGGKLAGEILRRLKFSNEDLDRIVHCVRNHMHFMHVTEMRRSTLRRLVGAPTFAAELELHRLDCLGSHAKLDNWQFVSDFAAALAREPVLPAPWITGTDIMALGIPEGPDIKVWKQKAYDAQLEARFPDRETLLEWMKGEIVGGRS